MWDEVGYGKNVAWEQNVAWRWRAEGGRWRWRWKMKLIDRENWIGSRRSTLPTTLPEDAVCTILSYSMVCGRYVIM